VCGPREEGSAEADSGGCEAESGSGTPQVGDDRWSPPGDVYERRRTHERAGWAVCTARPG
jgi:hypothetical protein